MVKARSVFACTECGAQHPRWLGRCPECGRFSTLVEERVGGAEPPGGNLLAVPSPPVSVRPRALSEIDAAAQPRLSTGMAEVDRVLGGGLVPGSVVLLGGEPGVGKSTLALQIAARIRERGDRVLYVSGEESAEQIRLRADRLAEEAGAIEVLTETRVEALAATWGEQPPALVLIDSIQTAHCERTDAAPGSVSQVRECAALLATAAKSCESALLLVGHVTKEGTLAGPRVLEHLVDVVLNFEGDRQHAFRLLRASKNRFGSTQEVGVFQMGEHGLEAVTNPSALFLAERRAGTSGSCIVPLLEGTRPMLVEVQALVAPATYGTPRRTSIGVEDGRVALLLAVLERRANIDLLSRDVYVNAAGGVRASEAGADLGLALAIVSSCLDLAVPDDVAACGEIGLGGEVRRVARTPPRIAEAARQGFRRVLVPKGGAPSHGQRGGCAAVELGDVADAVAWLRANATPAAPRPAPEIVNVR